MVRKECSHIWSESLVSARQLAKLTGLLTSSLPAVKPAPLHYRALQSLRNEALLQGDHFYNQRVSLSHESQLDFQWWTQNILTDLQRPKSQALLSPYFGNRLDEGLLSHGTPGHRKKQDTISIGWN